MQLTETVYRCKVCTQVIIAAITGLKKTKRIHIPCEKLLLITSSINVKPTFSSPLVMKVRSRSGSVMSGASTPGGGAFRSLSEGDLKKADAALSQVNGTDDTVPIQTPHINGISEVTTVKASSVVEVASTQADSVVDDTE